MGTFTVPVLPYVAPYGGASKVVLSLADVAPAKNICLSAFPDENLSYQNAKLQFFHTDAAMLASLGFPGVADSRVNAKFFCSYLDLMATKKARIEPDADSIVTGATFGVGFRMAIVAYGMDASVTSSFSGIAASAKLGIGSTSYQILPIGGGLEVLRTAKPLITNLTGDFTIETLEAIGAVQHELAQLYVNKNTRMTPELVSVDIDIDKLAWIYSGGKSEDYMHILQGQHYALQRAYRGESSNEAIGHGKDGGALWPVPDDGAAPDYEGIVQDFYSRILKLEADEKPAALQKQIQLMVSAGD